MVVVDACHADTTVDEFVYFSRRTETKVSVPIRASTVLLVLCAQSLCIDAWVKPRYNQPWSPAAPSRAADFESRLASATALLQSDWQPTLNVQTVPYIYTSGSSNADVKLNYVADALGNNIPDFSHAGFEGGGVALPTDGGSAPIIHLAPSGNGTDAANLIATIASVLSLPTNAAGWKAVIQLAAGTYDLRTANGAVQLTDRMGYIVRGAGSGQGGTTLLCNDTCFFLNGRQVTLSNATDITRHVTTGSYRIYLANTAIFAVNDHVHVNMSVTAQWASDMQYNGTGTWHAVLRTVTAVSTQYIDLEVPLYYPIYQGTVSKASAVYVHHIGFAHLRAIRPSGTPNLGVVFDAHGLVQDVFVKDVVSEYFGTLLQGSGLHSRRWTFEDCVALFNPIASIEPDIRQTFRLYHLSQLFIHRVSAQYSRDFLTSNNVLTASCVVISHCTDIRPWRPMYYAFGAMYPGQLLEATYSEMGTDWSWNAAFSGYYAVSSVQWNNYVAYEDGSPGLYKCAGPTLIGQNVCVGNSKDNSSYWNDVRNQRPVLPTSLYMQQLRDRLGCAAVDSVFWPAQISGTFQYPTANSTSTWLISNMNQYDTNKTDWITGNATLFYRGDPDALQYSACTSSSSGSEGPVSVDNSAGNTPSVTLTDGALAGTVIGSVLGAALLVSAVLLIVYRHQVRAKCAS